MADTIFMKYNNYRLRPTPMVSINKTFNKTADGTPIGAVFSVVLEGTVCVSPSGGLLLVDAEQDRIFEAFEDEGAHFHLYCSGASGAATDIINNYPRIISVQFDKSRDNWYSTSPYRIELEFDDLGLAVTGGGPFSQAFNSSFDNSFTGIPMFISEASDEWQFEFLEDRSYYQLNLTGIIDRSPYAMRLQHTLGATGKRHFDQSGLQKPAWEQAREYVMTRLGFESDKVVASGIINMQSTGLYAFNHVRVYSLNELGGTFNVTETWLVLNNSGIANTNALEDFSVEMRKSNESDITNITINGTIEGLEVRNYGSNPGEFSITTSKYTNASGYWSVIQNRLYERCRTVGGATTRSLNVLPLAQSVVHNITKGNIAYGYDFNDRPSNCVTGALSEHIVITDQNQVDLFASIPILGRQAGPLLQDLRTKGGRTRELSIEVVMAPYSGCFNTSSGVAALLAAAPTTQIDTIVDAFYQNLSGTYSQVFKSQDSPSWNPKDGRYSRTVAWEYGACI